MFLLFMLGEHNGMALNSLVGVLDLVPLLMFTVANHGISPYGISICMQSECISHLEREKEPCQPIRL